MKLGRTTKIRQNFFVPSAHSIILDTSVSSLHGSTRLLSLSSSVLAFVPILANRSSSAQPVLQVFSIFVPTHLHPLCLPLFILPPRLVASTFCPRQYHSSFLALLGVPCIQCSCWV